MNSIYQYINKINGHMYIGLAKDPKRRYNDHLSASFNLNNKDYNLAIHRAIRKYDIENFDFNILEDNLENSEKMKEREIYWIAYYNTYNNREHYNETPGGDLVGEKSSHKGSEHGKAVLTEEEVIKCREAYKKGFRSRDIYEKFYKDKIKYSGFLNMWHGKTWKHIMPEVFENNPHRAKYGEQDRDIITALFKESNQSLRQFVKDPKCYVGYGTLWKMINEPSFYDGK